MFDTCDGFNCNPSCMTQILPGARTETDGLFVWLVVLITLASAMLVVGAGEKERNLTTTVDEPWEVSTDPPCAIETYARCMIYTHRGTHLIFSHAPLLNVAYELYILYE